MATKKTTKATTPAKAAKKPAKKAGGKLRLTSASPSLTVNDIETSMAWYRDVLGFTIGERWEDGGKLLGAEIAAGDVTFMIGQDDWKKGRNRVKGVGLRLYCTTNQDIDKLAARIKDNGGTPDGPKDTPWGTREFAVDDPDGFKITIAKETKKRR